MLEFLVPIISFLGIFIGVLLKKIAKEEIKFGKHGPKYFVWMKRIILFLILLVMLYFTNDYTLVGIGIIIGIILGIFITEYLFLSMALVFSFTQTENLLLIISSLVFLYGLPYGSILRKIKLQFIPTIIFFFLPFSLLLITPDINLIIGIAAGGLFQYIVRK